MDCVAVLLASMICIFLNQKGKSKVQANTTICGPQMALNPSPSCFSGTVLKMFDAPNPFTYI